VLCVILFSTPQSHSPLDAHACVSQVLFNTCMRGWEGVGSGFSFSLSMMGACLSCWRGRLCFGRRRDKGFCLVYFSIFAGVLTGGGCVCACIRAYTHRLLRYLM